MTRNSPKWDFFLAHAGADEEAAESLYDYLVGRCRVFLGSRDLRPGDNWDTALAAAQRQSLVTVVLVSTGTEAAYYQREEIAAAIALAREDPGGHRVVPIYTDVEANSSGVPYGLRIKHGIVIGHDVNLAEAAARLLDLLRSLREDGASRQTEPPVGQEARRPSRAPERVALLRRLGRLPEDFDAYFSALWQAGFGKERILAEHVGSLETRRRALVRDYSLIIEKLPDAFADAAPSEREKGQFAEVFPALQRECAACFEASRTLVGGLSVSTGQGEPKSIPFSMLYSALEVREHLRVIRMAAEELVIQFPLDEVEEARRERTT